MIRANVLFERGSSSPASISSSSSSKDFFGIGIPFHLVFRVVFVKYVVLVMLTFRAYEVSSGPLDVDMPAVARPALELAGYDYRYVSVFFVAVV
jgi:hypothetical protein